MRHQDRTSHFARTGIGRAHPQRACTLDHLNERDGNVEERGVSQRDVDADEDAHAYTFLHRSAAHSDAPLPEPESLDREREKKGCCHVDRSHAERILQTEFDEQPFVVERESDGR
eukprot:1722597-Rhodomonas_salina.4